MILRCVYSNRVWIGSAEFWLKLHKILNLGTLSSKTSAAKSDERFSKWRKFLLTKSFVYKKVLVRICQVTKHFAFEVFTDKVFSNKIAWPHFPIVNRYFGKDLLQLSKTSSRGRGKKYLKRDLFKDMGRQIKRMFLFFFFLNTPGLRK